MKVVESMTLEDLEDCPTQQVIRACNPRLRGRAKSTAHQNQHTKKNGTKGLLFNGLPPNRHHVWLTDSNCAATDTVLLIEVKSLHAFICLQEELLREQKLQIQEKNKQLQEKSTATLASILAITAIAVATKFLSSLLGIGDAVCTKVRGLGNAD